MLKLTVAKWAKAFMIPWAHTKQMVVNASGRAESFTPAVDIIFIRPSSDGTYYGMVMSVRPFSTLFSFMLWHIELKFCTWLCFNVLQIKFECHYFASIFEGVMPLCELRIWEIQFSALFSYMLWHIELKFCTWLCFDVLQSKFECHLFASIFEGVMPLLKLRIYTTQQKFRIICAYFFVLWTSNSCRLWRG